MHIGKYRDGWWKGQELLGKLPQHTANSAGILEKVTKSILDKVSLHFDMTDAKQQGATQVANFYFISFLKKILRSIILYLIKTIK